MWVRNRILCVPPTERGTFAARDYPGGAALGFLWANENVTRVAFQNSSHLVFIVWSQCCISCTQDCNNTMLCCNSTTSHCDGTRCLWQHNSGMPTQSRVVTTQYVCNNTLLCCDIAILWWQHSIAFCHHIIGLTTQYCCDNTTLRCDITIVCWAAQYCCDNTTFCSEITILGCGSTTLYAVITPVVLWPFNIVMPRTQCCVITTAHVMPQRTCVVKCILVWHKIAMTQPTSVVLQ